MPPVCSNSVRRKSPTLTQRDVGGVLGFVALAAKVSPFKRFVSGDDGVQRAERGLIEFEFPVFNQPQKIL